MQLRGHNESPSPLVGNGHYIELTLLSIWLFFAVQADCGAVSALTGRDSRH